MTVSTPHAVGARRMWIRRWLQAGKIDQAEAARLNRALKQARVTRSTRRETGQSHVRDFHNSPLGRNTDALVTLQYDPSRFSVEFHRKRRKG